PTSETIIGEYMAKWVQSFRDLPLLLNQWANVVRWELRPRLFLRTSEFLWQEGHTAHASYEEARDYALRIAREAYADLMVNVLAIPVVLGHKTARERFAGAVNTITTEAMMQDGKALQMGTSHELGQNFSRAFGIEFTGPTGSRELAWTTSWGTSTRMVGGLIMGHGDDQGLRIPPLLAPSQVVVLAVKPEACDVAHKIGRELAAQRVRVTVDDRTDVPFGRRAVDWELRASHCGWSWGHATSRRRRLLAAARSCGVRPASRAQRTQPFSAEAPSSVSAELAAAALTPFPSRHDLREAP